MTQDVESIGTGGTVGDKGPLGHWLAQLELRAKTLPLTQYWTACNPGTTFR